MTNTFWLCVLCVACRTGTGLFVELHAIPPEASAVDGPVQLGYGLVPYEVRSCVTGAFANTIRYITRCLCVCDCRDEKSAEF